MKTVGQIGSSQPAITNCVAVTVALSMTFTFGYTGGGFNSAFDVTTGAPDK